MHFKINHLEIKNNFFLEELENFVEENRIFRKDPLVLEKNANSDLVAFSKPCTQEFFENVFSSSGPFWSVFSKLGFAVSPVNAKYPAFICGRLYFLKNVENRFMQDAGLEKFFEIRNEMLFEKRKLNLSNFLLILSFPFDIAKQFLRIIELSFLANESIKEFEDFKRRTIAYYNYHSFKQNVLDPLKIARESLGLAVQSLAYSNLALISYNLKIKLKKSKLIEVCESEILKELIKKKDFEAVKKTFGFYSLDPYDIAKPRFREDISDLEKYGAPEYPQNYLLKWRENAKFLAARYLNIERIAFQKLGEIIGLGDWIFYLKTSELENLGIRENRNRLLNIAKSREEKFKEYRRVDLPLKIIYFSGKIYQQVLEDYKEDSKIIAKATNVSAEKIASGSAVNINSLADYQKCKKGAIIVSKSLSPNLTILFDKAAGVISQSGALLSHSAVIAREMGIPCLIQARFNSEVEDGDYLKINGRTGEVKIVERR